MKNIARELREIVESYSRKIDAIPDGDFKTKPLPEKWSKIEVLGHLIDSAQNNLRRFICSQYEPIPPFISYDQNFWVACNQYQQMEKEEVIALWRLLNLRICAVLQSMPEENHSKNSNTGSLHTLHWLAADYVKHLKHHLNQIISQSFDVIYP